MKRPLLILCLVLTAVSAAALPPGEYSRVLLPLYLDQPLPGALGSSWTTEFAVHNPTNREWHLEYCRFESCFLDSRSDENLTSGETQTALPERLLRPEPGRGIVMWFKPVGSDPVAPTDALSVQLRAKDLSRQERSAGTEIPVVREAAFRTSTVRLLSVPVDGRFRAMLRIYDVDLDQASFAVRIFDETTGARVSETVVVATLSRPQSARFRFDPAYAQVAELSGAGAQRIRVEVEPLTSGSKFWAFISITNNESQEFTVVTPQ